MGKTDEELIADAEAFRASLGKPHKTVSEVDDPKGINDLLIEGLIDAASRRCDKSAARELLQMFCDQTQLEARIHPRLLRYVADAFDSVLSDLLPCAKALSLEGVKFGSKIKNNDERDRQLSQMVLMHSGLNAKRGAVKAAKETVANESGFGIDTINNVHKKWRKTNIQLFEKNGDEWPVIQSPPRK